MDVFFGIAAAQFFSINTIAGMFHDADDDEEEPDENANDAYIAEKVVKPKAFPPLLQIELILSAENTLALSPSQDVCCDSIASVIQNIKLVRTNPSCPLSVFRVYNTDVISSFFPCH